MFTSSFHVKQNLNVKTNFLIFVKYFVSPNYYNIYINIVLMNQFFNFLV